MMGGCRTSFILIFLMFSNNLSSQIVEFVNAGVSGNTTTDLIKRQSKIFDYEPDWVILMVGTNDMLNSRKLESYASYERKLKHIVSRFKKQKVKVVLVSPPTVDSIYLFKRHDKEKLLDEPNDKLVFVKRLMEKLADNSSVYFVDVFETFNSLGLPEHNKDEYIMNVVNSGYEDGVHPTPKGYQLIAQTIDSSLKAQEVILSGTVVCFGDSITFGQGVVGEGTVEGKTYPSLLREILKNENILNEK